MKWTQTIAARAETRCAPTLWQVALIIVPIFAAVPTAAAAAFQDAATPAARAASRSPDRASSRAAASTTGDRAQPACAPSDPRNIVVCGERGEGYRIDPDITQASREISANERSANTATPSAQAACSSQPMGCGHGLESLDLANAAIVIGRAVVKAAQGKDWTKTFKPGSDEYQLYLEAKQEREGRDAARAAAKVRMNARAAKGALGTPASE